VVWAPQSYLSGKPIKMNDNPVGWFEVPVRDMQRAKAFYESVFQCQLELHDMGPNQMAWFPWKEGGTGSAGALIKGEAYEPSHDGCIIYFTAPDLKAHLERVEANGGWVVFPITPIGEHGFIAHVADTEGNRIALHSREG